MEWTILVVVYIITRSHLQWYVCELEITWGYMNVCASAVSSG